MEESKKKFKVYIRSQNNFSVINRIVNILNRRRVRIISLFCSEEQDDIHMGFVDFVIYTHESTAQKATRHIEKIVEVKSVDLESIE